jgi:cyanophycin synthetase
MCQRIAGIIGLDCIGIDLIAPNLEQPLNHQTSGVVEVNAAPGFRMHLSPSEGKPRNVARSFVDMLFPPDKSFHVPIVAVTGTNGKTTTAKLIAHTLKYSGNMVGFAGTTGVEIDGVSVVNGDYSGPEGARMVFSEPLIDHAVLEVARGGIIRRGLGFDEADVGVLLNIDEDHIGTDAVEDLDDLSKVKATVIEVVKSTGIAVLNADDANVVGTKDRTKGQIIYFSLAPDSPTIMNHLAAGGTAVVLDNGNVLVRSSEPDVLIIPIADAPITIRGIVTFNSANVLAAVAALIGLGTNIDVIRTGISTFHPSATQNPGRLNIIDFNTFKLIVDYGHNVPAVRALGEALPHFTRGRKIVVAHGTGNRPEELLKKFGATLAQIYDYIIITDPDPRNRELGVTADLVKTGVLECNFDPQQLEIVVNPFDAADRAFEIVQTGDLIVIQVDETEPMLERVTQHFDRIMETL